MSTTTPPPAYRERGPLAIGLDVFFVVLFAAAGKRSHDEDGSIGYVFEIAAPFLIALAIGWAIAIVGFGAWQRAADLRIGILVWATTVAGGMLLRRTVFDRTTATTFVVVTALFLAACMFGWRIIALVVDRRRATSA